MPIRRVARAIRQVRAQLKDYPTSDYWYNEATTRLTLTDPMIKSLGWDLYDLYQCGYEIDTGDAAFSAISLWEIGMLQHKNHLNIALNLAASQWRERLLAEGFREIPVDGSIAVRAGELPDMHGDPADRIIVATALGGGHRLITSRPPHSQLAAPA